MVLLELMSYVYQLVGNVTVGGGLYSENFIWFFSSAFRNNSFSVGGAVVRFRMY